VGQREEEQMRADVLKVLQERMVHPKFERG
jgi:hypothetical protein